MNDFSSDSASDYVLEDQIGFKLRLAHQKHAETFALTLPDVTPTQFSLLWKLHECGSVSQNELGRQVASDAATVKGVIDRLKKRSFVQTHPSKTDLRRLDVSLTEEGSAFLVSAIVSARNISKLTTRRLSKREEQQLLSLLDKLIE
ncbi:MarR family winged helix-turn-helix transcriptional regulator [Cypionkella psychrotolerans]|uniref:MarR family winged helix-turn-helix transcriptional regulator n=1 Tax=Cypionkella psychrotolerans TaxID=1678131 RepID=UPI0006B671AD|nr:MarR family transcriptional regulator [Cypionkella psychrotolerans]